MKSSVRTWIRAARDQNKEKCFCFDCEACRMSLLKSFMPNLSHGCPACLQVANPGNIIWKYIIWHDGQMYAKSTNSQCIVKGSFLKRQRQKVGYSCCSFGIREHNTTALILISDWFLHRSTGRYSRAIDPLTDEISSNPFFYLLLSRSFCPEQNCLSLHGSWK